MTIPGLNAGRRAARPAAVARQTGPVSPLPFHAPPCYPTLPTHCSFILRVYSAAPYPPSVLTPSAAAVVPVSFLFFPATVGCGVPSSPPPPPLPPPSLNI